ESPCDALLDIIKYINEKDLLSESVEENEILKTINKSTLEKTSFDKSLDFSDVKSIQKRILKKARESIYFSYLTIVENINVSYDLNEIDSLMMNNISILSDRKIILISPVLFDFETWKRVIVYELERLADEKLIEEKIQKVIASLHLLSSRLLLSKVPIINLGFHNDDFTIDRICFYDLSPLIDKEIEFVYQLDSKLIFHSSIENLKRRLRQVNLLKKELENKLRKKKLILVKTKYQKQVIKGLTYLLSKQNKTFDQSIINSISKYIIKEL